MILIQSVFDTISPTLKKKLIDFVSKNTDIMLRSTNISDKILLAGLKSLLHLED